MNKSNETRQVAIITMLPDSAIMINIRTQLTFQEQEGFLYNNYTIIYNNYTIKNRDSEERKKLLKLDRVAIITIPRTRRVFV